MSSTVSSCGGEAVETLVTEFDVAIIGGGIVGLATAIELAERAPGRRLAVLEKEPHLAAINRDGTAASSTPVSITVPVL